MKQLSDQEWESIYDSVFGYCIKRTNSISDSQDLTQSAITTFIERNVYPSNPGGYIMNIAKFKLLEYYRAKNKKIASVDDFDSHTFSTKEFDMRVESLIKCAKKHLPKTDWSIIELSILYDYSSREVADRTNLSPGNVRQKLSRNLKKVRKQCAKFWQ